MLEKISSLTDAQIYYIVNALAKVNSSPESVKKSFDEFFAPSSISGNLLMQVALDHKEEVKALRQKNEERKKNFTDIKLYDDTEQFAFLERIAEYCMEERTVAFDREGNPISRAMPDSATRAVLGIGKLKMQLKLLEMKEGVGRIDYDLPKISMKVVHSEETNE